MQIGFLIFLDLPNDPRPATVAVVLGAVFDKSFFGE